MNVFIVEKKDMECDNADKLMLRSRQALLFEMLKDESLG